MTVQKIKSGRINTVDASTYVGTEGTIFYNEDLGDLRLSDGVTPGGILLSTGSSTGTYTLITATNVRLGGVIIGAGIQINGQGVISVNTSTLVGPKGDTGTFTGSVVTSIVAGTGTFISTSTGAVTIWVTTASTFNTGTLVATAVDVINQPNLSPYTTTSTVQTLIANSLTEYVTLTDVQTLTNKTLTSPTITDGVFQDTFSIGNQIFYEHGYNGFSVNEDFDIVGNEGNFTGYHYTSGAGRDGVAFTLARTGQFTTGFGIHGTSESNEYVIGSETGNTDFVFKSSIGMPFNVSGGSEIFRISNTGILTVVQNENTETVATESFVTGQGYITSTDQILWVNSSPNPSTIFRTAATADSTGLNINITTGLPGLGSVYDWLFDTTKITFPDNTEQTTAWTGTNITAAYATTATTATNAGYAYSFNTSTLVATAVTANTSTYAQTVTSAAQPNITSVGTLTGLTVVGSATATNVTVTSLTLNRVPFVSTGGKLIDNANFYVDNPNALFYAGGGGAYIGGTGGYGTVSATRGLINSVDVLGLGAKLNVTGGSYFSGNLYITGITTVTNTTVSVSTVTGALQIRGGVGIGGDLYVGGNVVSTGTVTSNAATAFIAGDAAISNVALQIPREGAIRNLYNGAGNNMYFDVSIGGASQGQFQFRSSSAFTNVLTMSPTAFNVNPEAVVTAKTASFGRLPWNSAIDTELTIDDYRWRITNSGGIYAQVISNTGGTKNSAWTAVAAISGSAVTQGGSTGILLPNNSWTTLYTFGSMASAGDTVTVTFQDKSQGRIYRVTFMRSDDGATTGYNIIGERLL